MQSRPKSCAKPRTLLSNVTNTLRALSGLAGSSAAGLGRRALLLLLLGQLDGRGARDGGGAQVGAVAALGGRVDDALVELARRGRGGERGGLLGLGGLVGARGQLGGQADGVGGVGVDADGLGRRGLLDWCSGGCWTWGGWKYLSVGETCVLAGVLVGQVERVAGELDTTGLLALAEVGVVLACIEGKIKLAMIPSRPAILSRWKSFPPCISSPKHDPLNQHPIS